MGTFALNTKFDSIQVRNVRLHGAADGLRVRQRFESALPDLDSAALGLTPQALLIVRQIAPTIRLHLDHLERNLAFGQAVQAELTRNAQHARRPWLHADAAEAKSVLFADESELMACLVRDWLRGMLAGHWWAPILLDGIPVPEWWRHNLLPRGDLLPAVLSLLAEQGEVMVWVARLGEAEVTQAITAIIVAHAMNTLPEWLKPAPFLQGAELPLANAVLSSSRDQESKTHSPAPPSGFRQNSVTALQHLVAVIPESQANTLTIPQRRLLVLALGLQRAAGWTRSPTFVTALQAMETGDENYTPNATTAVNNESRQDEHTARLPLPPSQVNQPAAMDTAATEAIDFSVSHLRRDGQQGLTVRPSTSSGRMVKPSMDRQGSPELRQRAQHERLDLKLSRVKLKTDSLVVRSVEQLSEAQSEDPSMHTSESLDPAVQTESKITALSPAATARSNNKPAMLFLQSIETQFGGIFYLLNVALALGLYGDFTQPRAPGIALSPWDLLALIGRAWFGRNFEQDPVWCLFAELAGRSPEEAPGRDFLPPDSWIVPDEWLGPWGEVRSAKVYATRKRLQIWHEAGFILIDVARDVTLAPLAQAAQLCSRSEILGVVLLVRVYKQPHRNCSVPLFEKEGVGEIFLNKSPSIPLFQRGRRLFTLHQLTLPVTGNSVLKRWLHSLLLYLHARLRRALGDDVSDTLTRLVCCHTAKVNCTATTLDVHLVLATLPIKLRIAGLDRNPGWIPAAGRSIAFHFE